MLVDAPSSFVFFHVQDFRPHHVQGALEDRVDGQVLRAMDRALETIQYELDTELSPVPRVPRFNTQDLKY